MPKVLISDSLSEDAVVAVCLCTKLGRGESTASLDVREWAELVVALHHRAATPRDLLDADAPERTPRIEELLRGLGSVGIEIERLESSGIWVLTRGDDWYPRAWKQRLGANAGSAVPAVGRRLALPATDPDLSRAEAGHSKEMGLADQVAPGVLAGGVRVAP